MIECAKAGIKSPGTYWHGKYSRLVIRRGYNRATAAVARSMMVAIYYMIKNDEDFEDIGADYYLEQHKAKIANRAVKSLVGLGYQVELTQTSG